MRDSTESGLHAPHLRYERRIAEHLSRQRPSQRPGLHDILRGEVHAGSAPGFQARRIQQATSANMVAIVGFEQPQ